MSINQRFPCGRVDRSVLNRRAFLRKAGAGFGSLALLDLLQGEGLLATESKIALPHFAPRAKSVIWLFMEGGPSAMDTFDPKPELLKHHGQRPSMLIDVFFGSPGPLMRSPYGFQQYGQSGTWVCEKMPFIAQH